jgi:hypothetical protein
MGIYFLIGIKGTLTFFIKKGKRQGSAFFFLGFLLTLILRFNVIGSFS